jgi:hypothetical protein
VHSNTTSNASFSKFNRRGYDSKKNTFIGHFGCATISNSVLRVSHITYFQRSISNSRNRSIRTSITRSFGTPSVFVVSNNKFIITRYFSLTVNLLTNKDEKLQEQAEKLFQKITDQSDEIKIIKTDISSTANEIFVLQREAFPNLDPYLQQQVETAEKSWDKKSNQYNQEREELITGSAWTHEKELAIVKLDEKQIQHDVNFGNLMNDFIAQSDALPVNERQEYSDLFKTRDQLHNNAEDKIKQQRSDIEESQKIEDIIDKDDSVDHVEAESSKDKGKRKLDDDLDLSTNKRTKKDDEDENGKGGNTNHPASKGSLLDDFADPSQELGDYTGGDD